MRKIINIIFCIIVVFAVAGIAMFCTQKNSLRQNIIRMHVVANSDSPEDQLIKIQLKDSLVEKMQPIVSTFTDKAQAKEYILENLSEIEKMSQEVLRHIGYNTDVRISFQPEEFDIRIYDTFSLPSGVYDALRIEIGEAAGKNWWCVVFPSLCIPATAEEFQTVSVSAGFSQTLTNILQKNEGYEIRFFLLDCLGKLENLFH